MVPVPSLSLQPSQLLSISHPCRDPPPPPPSRACGDINVATVQSKKEWQERRNKDKWDNDMENDKSGREIQASPEKCQSPPTPVRPSSPSTLLLLQWLRHPTTKKLRRKKNPRKEKKRKKDVGIKIPRPEFLEGMSG